MRLQQKIILSIVLMLIGSASGVPVISFVDEGQTITTTPGSVVHLEIWTNETMIGLEARIELDGDAIISGAINISDCAAYGWDPTLSFDPSGIGTKVVEIGLGKFEGNSKPIVAYVDVTYGSGEIIVEGYPRDPGMPGPFPPPNYFSDGFVTIIPEPATLLLLATGTLVLLRKRRH